MARRTLLEIEGISELMNCFENSTEDSKQALDKAGDKSSDLILSKSKNYVVVKSGNLKKSLDKAKIKSKKNTSSFYKVYSKGKRQGGVRYGFAVELGTKKNKPQPFLRPAVDNSKTEIDSIYSNEINNMLDRNF